MKANKKSKNILDSNSSLLKLTSFKEETKEGEGDSEAEEAEPDSGRCDASAGKKKVAPTMTGCLPENLASNFDQLSSLGQKLSQVNDNLACHPKPPSTGLDPTNNEYDFKSRKALASSTNLGLGSSESENITVGRHRYYIAMMGLAIAAVNCYAQATFCIAIVEMVMPADLSAPIKEEQDQASLIKIADERSCPIEYRYRDYYDSWRFPTNLSSREQQSRGGSSDAEPAGNTLIDLSERFDWDASHQGVLLGAFAVGSAPLQVLGGRLAEIYGAKWVLLLGCLGTAITNLTIPMIAKHSFILLVFNRIMMGISQAGMEPGLMCLLAGWLTPDETGLFISMLLFAICTGFFLGSLGSSFLLTSGYGWPATYYVSGYMNLLVALVWFIYATSWPHQSRHITQQELSYIERAQQVVRTANDDLKLRPAPQRAQSGISALIGAKGPLSGGAPDVEQPPSSGSELHLSSTGAPWKNILSTRSVWAFIICKISIRWCADVLSIELPTYLANVLHLSIKLNGILNSVSSALFAIFSFITGLLVNEILKLQQHEQQLQRQISDGKSKVARLILEPHRASSPLGHLKSWLAGLSKTNLRKTMQSLASFGSALTVFLMTHYDCNIIFSMSMMLLLSCCLVLGTGGELQIPYDMTSRYPGTLHGMACTLSVSGWLAPPLIGLILGDQPSSRYRWSIVWYLTALINLIGGLVFLLFADASPRDFNSGQERKIEADTTTTSTTTSDQEEEEEEEERRGQNAATGRAVTVGCERKRRRRSSASTGNNNTNGVERKSDATSIPSGSSIKLSSNNHQVNSNNKRRARELDGYCNQLWTSQDNSPVLQTVHRQGLAATSARQVGADGEGRAVGAPAYTSRLVFNQAGRRRRASLPGLERPEVAARWQPLAPLARLATHCALGRRRKQWKLVSLDTLSPGPDVNPRDPIQQLACSADGEGRGVVTRYALRPAVSEQRLNV